VPNFTRNVPAEAQLYIQTGQLSICPTDYASAYAGKYTQGMDPNSIDSSGSNPESSGIIVRARLVPGSPHPLQTARVGVGSILDGASNTILLGEKLMNNTATSTSQPEA
jgi:hypothetical protein